MPAAPRSAGDGSREPGPGRLRRGVGGGRVRCRAARGRARGGARAGRQRDRAGQPLQHPGRGLPSPEDERAVLAGEGATEVMALRVADEPVGELRLSPRGAPPAPVLMRMVTTLIAQEVDRAQAPERASEAAVGRLPLRPALAQAHRSPERARPRRGAGLRPVGGRRRGRRPRQAPPGRGGRLARARAGGGRPRGARRGAHLPGRHHRAGAAAAAARRATRSRPRAS